MAKISTYAKDSSVNLKDRLFGSDYDNNNATKNFCVEDVFDFFNQLNSISGGDNFYRFSTTDLYNEVDGVFNTNDGLVEFENITNLRFNNADRKSVVLNDYFDFISQFKNMLLIRVYNPSNSNIINYYNIDSVQVTIEDTETTGYDISVSLFEGMDSGELVDESIYSLGFVLKFEDEIIRVANDTERDALISNGLVEIGDVIYHVEDGIHYVLRAFPVIGENPAPAQWNPVMTNISNSTTSTSEIDVASSLAVKTLNDDLSSALASGLNGKVDKTSISDAIDSSSQTNVASSLAVKTLNDNKINISDITDYQSKIYSNSEVLNISYGNMIRFINGQSWLYTGDFPDNGGTTFTCSDFDTELADGRWTFVSGDEDYFSSQATLIIEGGGTDFSTKALLAAKFTFLESEIVMFNVINNNVYAVISNTNYESGNGAFLNNTNITKFIEKGGLWRLRANLFNGCSNLTYVECLGATIFETASFFNVVNLSCGNIILPNVTSVTGANAFRNVKDDDSVLSLPKCASMLAGSFGQGNMGRKLDVPELISVLGGNFLNSAFDEIYAPKLVNLGNNPAVDEQVFAGMSGSTITVNYLVKTINAGSPDPDITSAEVSNTVIYADEPPILSVANASAIKQFDVNLNSEQIEFAGGSFDPINKRFTATGQTFGYIYIHNILGNDSTAEPFNYNAPYQSLEAATQAALAINNAEDIVIYNLAQGGAYFYNNSGNVATDIFTHFMIVSHTDSSFTFNDGVNVLDKLYLDIQGTTTFNFISGTTDLYNSATWFRMPNQTLHIDLRLVNMNNNQLGAMAGGLLNGGIGTRYLSKFYIQVANVADQTALINFSGNHTGDEDIVIDQLVDNNTTFITALTNFPIKNLVVNLYVNNSGAVRYVYSHGAIRLGGVSGNTITVIGGGNTNRECLVTLTGNNYENVRFEGNSQNQTGYCKIRSLGQVINISRTTDVHTVEPRRSSQAALLDYSLLSKLHIEDVNFNVTSSVTLTKAFIQWDCRSQNEGSQLVLKNVGVIYPDNAPIAECINMGTTNLNLYKPQQIRFIGDSTFENGTGFFIKTRADLPVGLPSNWLAKHDGASIVHTSASYGNNANIPSIATITSL